MTACYLTNFFCFLLKKFDMDRMSEDPKVVMLSKSFGAALLKDYREHKCNDPKSISQRGYILLTAYLCFYRI